MALGNIIAIQDADLEYDVLDLKKIVRKIVKEKKQVIYGSRFLNGGRKGLFSFYIGNKALSLLTSMLFMQRITDMETCYKVFRRGVIAAEDLESNRFDIEPEITAKIIKKISQSSDPIILIPNAKDFSAKVTFISSLLRAETIQL